MLHPDIVAALAKERRNAMLAEAASARMAGETPRHRRATGSPEDRRSGGEIRQRGPVPLTKAVKRIGRWLAGLPSVSRPYGPATVAASEKGGKS